MPKLNASKIKSPHESSTKTKAFKESHLAYETLGTWKTSIYVVLFCNAILGFKIFPFQVLTWIISKVAAKFQQCIGWLLTQNQCFRNISTPVKRKKKRIWGVVEQSIFSSIFAIPPKQSEYKIFNLKPLKGANCCSLTRNMIFLALEVSPGVRQDPSPTGTLVKGFPIQPGKCWIYLYFHF